MSVFRPDIYLGKSVVVVGASSGINLHLATCFAHAGAELAVISRDENRIQAAARQISTAGGTSVTGFAADVRDVEKLEQVMTQISDKLGAIDILVSGAAGNFIANAADMSTNGFKSVVDIDLLGSFNVLRTAYPYLRKPGASIINISAPQADNPYPGQSHVCSAKAGVNMLTQTLALEWGAEGIRINAISPGPIKETEGMKRLTPNPKAEKKLSDAIPLKRFGEKNDIAMLAMFLCTEEASYITGAIIPCDGGFSLMGAGAWG